jgi:hypothetical protein
MVDKSAYMQARRLERRQALIALSGGRCSVIGCGSTHDLEFDHIDPTTKLFVLSGCNLDKSWDIILREHAKCVLYCHECHLHKTREFDEMGGIPVNKNNEPYHHGTARMYSETGCRCDHCKQAKRMYRDKQISYTDHLTLGVLGSSPSA